MGADIEAVTGRIVRKNTERGLSVAAGVIGLLFLVGPQAFTAGSIYDLMGRIAPQSAWGTALFGLGLSRLFVLWVNGFWPIGPKVRMCLSLATFFFCWVPFVLSFWWFAFLRLTGEVSGPPPVGAVMSPLIAWCELMCFVALRAWVEAQSIATLPRVGENAAA
jgi:hypothetical protein